MKKYEEMSTTKLEIVVFDLLIKWQRAKGIDEKSLAEAEYIKAETVLEKRYVRPNGPKVIMC